jgi:hypothetical protein
MYLSLTRTGDYLTNQSDDRPGSDPHASSEILAGMDTVHSSTTLFRGFTRRGLTTLLLLVVAVSLAVTGFFINGRYQARIQMERSANLAIAQALAAGFAGFTDDLLRQESSIGFGLTSGGVTPAETEQILSASRAQQPAVQAFSWVDASGRIVASSDPNRVGTSIAAEPFFRGIMSGSDTRVGNLPSGSGRSTVQVGRAMISGGGITGIVVAEADPLKIAFPADLTAASGFDFLLLDPSGNVVDISQREEERRPGPLTLDPALLKAAHTGKESTGSYAAPRAEGTWLASVAPAGSTGWAAIAARSEEQALSPVHENLLRDIALTAACEIAALALGIWLIRLATPPGRPASSGEQS